MKKIFLTFLTLFFAIFLFNYTFSFDFDINNYNVDIKLLSDWTVNICEDIDVFFNYEKHWIIREIPLSYLWWKFQIFVSNVKVEKYNFEAYKEWRNYKIKIWSANKLIEWEKNYKICYDIYWLVRKFSWYQELYMDIVWTDRSTTVKNINFKIHLPKRISVKSWDYFVYYWWYWSKNIFTGVEFLWNEIIWHKKTLWYYQWITIWIKFSSGYFFLSDSKQESLLIKKIDYTARKKSYFRKILIENNIFSGFMFFLEFVVIFYIYYKNKKKKKKKKPYIIQYSPPKWLSASEVWVIKDWVIDWVDITVMIYDLAIKWYLKIEWEKWGFLKKSKYSLVKKKDISEKEPEYLQYFFWKLFKTKEKIVLSKSSLSWTVSSTMWKLKKHIKPQKRFISKKKNFKIKQNRFTFDETKYITYFFWWIFLIMIILTFFRFNLGISLRRLIFLWRPIYILFKNVFLWKKEILTKKWQELYRHIKWYKKFLKHVDKDKLETFLKEDPLFFDKTLPYAIILWLWSKFIKKITPFMDQPDWYVWDSFSSSMLADSFNIIQKSAVAVVSSYWYSWRSFSSSSFSYSSSSWFSWWSSFSSSSSGFSWWWGGWGGWSSW